jgi:phosphohistidine phosphatase
VNRTLIVLRHAKSEYPPAVSDYDRPLAPRGVADAAVAGEWIRDHVGIPGAVAVSTARRTRQTWALVAGPLGYTGSDPLTPESGPLGTVNYDERIYDARVRTLLEVVREFPDSASCALLVGHNPGMEELVELLAATADPTAAELLAKKYPTNATAILTINGDWAELAPNSAHLAAFTIPRSSPPPFVP